MHSLPFPSWGYVFNNDRQFFGGGEGGAVAPLCLSHISHCYICSINCSGPDYSNTAQIPICINPLVRSPAQAHVLEFKCLPLSQFHSQIPKIYTFRTWYSLSLCQSFLCLGSPCHPTAKAKSTGFNTEPTALSKSSSEYQNTVSICTHQ